MEYGLKHYFFQVLDARKVAITSGLKISILAADGAIATIYADSAKTSLTNPIPQRRLRHLPTAWLSSGRDRIRSTSR